MSKQHFTITINAPKQKVWDIMLSNVTYRQWTEVFSPGSYFEGSWEQGADIKFLGPNDKGELGGMVSRIRENRLHEYISIEHLGMIQDGKVDMESPEVKAWVGAQENYTFKTIDDGTEVSVELDIDEKYAKMFEEVWPKALQKLKEIVEKEAKSHTNITVETIVNAPIEKVWETWTEPKHITKWAFASDDWEAPHAENDIRTGGKFSTTMAAKDKSASFNFNGVYTNVKAYELIEYDIEGGRHVKIQFTKQPNGIKITETFDIEYSNSIDLQKDGWQAILENYKKYIENNT